MTDRSIVLLRHAKAERPAGTPDIERRLSARGHADAAAAGAWLAHGGHLPELVICSPAKRTRQTWHDVALGMAAPPTLGAPDRLGGAVPPTEPTGGVAVPGPTPSGPTVRYEAAIYAGATEDLLDLVRSTDAGVGTLLLIGHNPTISELSNVLDPVHADPDGLRTSGIVVHGVPVGWSELGGGQAPVTAWHTARG